MLHHSVDELVMAASASELAGMDQECANKLVDEGAILLFLDVPESTEFGIDYMSWSVGPKFRGVKMVPPGVHFVYYCARNVLGESGFRTGFFYNFRPKEILIKKWDKQTEDIKNEESNSEELLRYQSNWREFDTYLGAYPHEKYRQWVALSGYISQASMEKLEPDSKKIYSATPLVATGKKTEDGLPEMVPIKGSIIKFTEIAKKCYPKNATPSQISHHNMDLSYTLATILNQRYSEDEFGILGELQFQFVCFLIGQVFEAFQSWKCLLHLLCCCEEALITHPLLYINFINVLHFQVKEIPEDMFTDIVANNNFLVCNLRTFFQATKNDGVDKDLQVKAQRFCNYLTRKFHWDFSSESEEDSPVVV